MVSESDGLVVAGLTKSYRAKTVVNDVSFRAESGSVTGLIGPNGSGKSTTLRMIVGHTRPDLGSALFCGSSFSHLSEPGRSVGVLLDAAAHHPGRSVVETARLAGTLLGVKRPRIDECLEAVGVDSVSRRLVGSLSLGMRQRLGLALSILGAPRFLILDEPANGLDPEGIHWLRTFLRGFADQGGCVLVSSHQIAEIQAAANSVVVIDRGRVVQARSVGRGKAPSVCVRSSNDGELGTLLVQKYDAHVRSVAGGGLLVDQSCVTIGAAAFEAGLRIELLSPSERSLEEEFLDSTHGEFEGLSGDTLLDIVSRDL